MVGGDATVGGAGTGTAPTVASSSMGEGGDAEGNAAAPASPSAEAMLELLHGAARQTTAEGNDTVEGRAATEMVSVDP